MQPDRAEKDRRYRKQRLLRIHRGHPTSLIPATPAANHAQALTDLGWSSPAIAQLAGNTITDTTIVNLLRGRHTTIERKTAAAILAIPLTTNVPERVADNAFVPVLGAQRRIHALMRLGWSRNALRDKCGIDASHVARAVYPQITARKWRTIEALFAELCFTPGPSPITATRAERSGYQHALVWDDLDDPLATPQGVKRRRSVPGRPLIRDRHIEDAEWMADADETLTSACARLGIKPDSLYAACKRAGRVDVYDRLADRETNGLERADMRNRKRDAA